MKSIKNIKLLMVIGLLLQVDIGFARGKDWAEQGQAIEKNLQFLASLSDSKLIEAAKEGNLEDLKSALNDPKANINDIGEKSGMTALMYASRRGHTDMVVLLLNKGADPHIRSAWGSNTALREAVKGGHKEIVKLLLDKCNASASARLSMAYALIKAAQNGRKDMVELLLDNGADPNIEGDYNVEGDCNSDEMPTSTTALIEASRQGHKDIVKLLLNKGANPNIGCSTSSATALFLASSRGHKDIVKLLLDNGANPHIRHVFGDTALEIAKLNGHQEIVQLIDKAIKARGRCA
jgi:ankyrin repeat protein